MSKSIPQMLAELSDKPELEEYRKSNTVIDFGEYEADSLQRLRDEVAVLKAAAERAIPLMRHADDCITVNYRRKPCTCGYDDMRKVLEELK